MKTAVETIFVGKGRLYNRRFLQMCSHYLVDPVACTPASSWEKGQVENQVGLVRQRFFTPRLRFKKFDELNAWLLDKCIAFAEVHPHPELTEQTIGVRMDLDRTTDSTGRHRVLVVEKRSRQVFETDAGKREPWAGRNEGFRAGPALPRTPPRSSRFVQQQSP